jgi:hypothetical protein
MTQPTADEDAQNPKCHKQFARAPNPNRIQVYSKLREPTDVDLLIEALMLISDQAE